MDSIDHNGRPRRSLPPPGGMAPPRGRAVPAPASGASAGRAVVETLARAGFRFRASDLGGPTPGRPESDETDLFARGVRLLLGGRFAGARDAFSAVLATSGGNRRAAALVELLSGRPLDPARLPEIARGTPADTAPADTAPAAEPPAPAARRWRLGRVPRRLALAAAALLLIGCLPKTLQLQGPARLVAGARGAVRAEVDGIVAEVSVREGEAIAAGTVVARLDRSDREAQLAMTRAEIRRARADLALLARGPAPEEIAQARAAVRAATAEVEQLAARHARLARLAERGMVADDLFEQAGKELTVARGRLRAAREQARLLERGAPDERLAAARAEVERLEARAADIERTLAACTLRAPIGGVVVTPAPERLVGQRLAAGASLLEIADPDSLEAEVTIPESEVGEVRTGQTVRLKFAAFPDASFPGRVVGIAPVAEPDPLGRAMFRVRASVQDAEGRLRAGMTGAARIASGRHAIAALVWRRALRLIDPALL